MNVSTESNHLSPRHQKECFETRSLDPRWISTNCRSVEASEISGKLGYTAKSAGIWLEGANHQGQFKPDKPWLSDQDKAEGKKKAPKYRSPLGEYDAMLPTHPDDPYYWDDYEKLKKQAYIVDGHPCLLLTEGFFKAIAGCAISILTIALLGVEMGLTSGKADPQGKRYLVPTLERFAKAGFGFILAFDADAATNKDVVAAQNKLAHQLMLFKVPVYVITGMWVAEEGKGMDDYIQRNGAKAFWQNVLGKAQSYEEWLKNLEQQLADTKSTSNHKNGSKDKDIPTPRQLGVEIAEKYQPTCAFHNEQKVWRIFNGKIWDAKEDEVFGQIIYREIKGRNIEYSTEAYTDNTIKGLRRELLLEKWETFDRKNWIAFNNGVLELDTNKLHEHNSGFKFVSCLPRDYKELNAIELSSDAISTLEQCCPHFYKWAMQAMGNDSKKVLKLLAVMNAAIRFRFFDLQYFVHLIGEPGSGKGTFARLLEKIVGEENSRNSKLANLNNDTEISRIINAQLLICDDEEKQVGLYGNLKKMTGGMKLSYREIYKAGAEDYFMGLLLVTSNMATFAGDTTGIYRRLCLIVFDNPIAAELRNPKVEELLESELSALTSVALMMSDDEVTKLIKGVGDAEIPEFKQKDREMKCQLDSMNSFINEELIYEIGAKTNIGTANDDPEYNLFAAYLKHIKESGRKNSYNKENFSQYLLREIKILGWDCEKRRSNRGFHVSNIRLRQRNTDDHLPLIQDMWAKPSEPSVDPGVDPSVDLRVDLKPALEADRVDRVDLYAQTTDQFQQQIEGLIEECDRTNELENNEISQSTKEVSESEPTQSTQSFAGIGFGSTPKPAPEPAPGSTPTTVLEIGDVVCDLSGRIEQIAKIAVAGYLTNLGTHVSRNDLKTGAYTKVVPTPEPTKAEADASMLIDFANDIDDPQTVLDLTQDWSQEHKREVWLFLTPELQQKYRDLMKVGEVKGSDHNE